MINTLINIKEVATLLLLICSFLYIRQLRKSKREGKASKFEIAMYIITWLAIALYAISYCILHLGNLN